MEFDRRCKFWPVHLVGFWIEFFVANDGGILYGCISGCLCVFVFCFEWERGGEREKDKERGRQV